MPANHGVTANCENGERKKFPFEIKSVDPSIDRQLLKDFTGEMDGFVQVGPKKYFFPSSFSNHAEQLYNFEARPDDIWTVTFPRSGTTLTQELIWLVANDFDYVRAQQKSLFERFTFFEFDMWIHEKMKEQYLHEHRHDPAMQNTIINEMYASKYEKLVDAGSPRFIKTHLPFSLLPASVTKAKPKIIYVARNPKDVAVSWYHYSRLFRHRGYVNNFSQFWNYFEKDLTMCSPYWEHVKEGWEHRDEPNVLFLFYEELINNLPATILKVASFLNKQVIDDDVERLVAHLNIENVRKNPSLNYKQMADCGFLNQGESPFIRKGQVTGKGWQQEYTPELVARAEAWIEKNLRETTLRFPE